MKQDADYEDVLQNCNPLELWKLIHKTIMAQTDDNFVYWRKPS